MVPDPIEPPADRTRRPDLERSRDADGPIARPRPAHRSPGLTARLASSAMGLSLIGLGVLAALAARAGGGPAPEATRSEAEDLAARAIDLTHPFGPDTIAWPTDKPFHWEKTTWGHAPGGYWYASATYGASEHCGTHLDSPIHFGEGQATTEAIPLERLIGPAVVIDVTAACRDDRDYRLAPGDIAAWEADHGPIPEGAIVLVRTGWAGSWPDRKRYLGTDAPGDVENLHFPGISAEAAGILVRRRVAGVGIDTASLDHGPSRDFAAHRVLNGAGIYGLENVAHLDRLPASGATLIALPMKIAGGSGGPTRVIAILPRGG